MEQFQVIRTTTDQLGDNLNSVAADGCVPYSVQWVGARDWIIISQAAPLDHNLDPAKIGGTDGPTDGGWAADQDRRHERYDAASVDYKNAASDIGPAAFTHLIDPEVIWGDIRYGRYDTTRVPTGHRWAGWIEDAAKSWILFLNEHGEPELYFPRRDANGGVIGSPIHIGVPAEVLVARVTN